MMFPFLVGVQVSPVWPEAESPTWEFLCFVFFAREVEGARSRRTSLCGKTRARPGRRACEAMKKEFRWLFSPWLLRVKEKIRYIWVEEI